MRPGEQPLLDQIAPAGRGRRGECRRPPAPAQRVPSRSSKPAWGAGGTGGLAAPSGTTSGPGELGRTSRRSLGWARRFAGRRCGGCRLLSPEQRVAARAVLPPEERRPGPAPAAPSCASTTASRCVRNRSWVRAPPASAKAQMAQTGNASATRTSREARTNGNPKAFSAMLGLFDRFTKEVCRRAPHDDSRSMLTAVGPSQ